MKIIEKIDSKIKHTEGMTIREIADVVDESPQAVKRALDINNRSYKAYEAPICEIEEIVATLTEPTTYQDLKRHCDVKRWQFYKLAAKYPMLRYNEVRECREELELIGAMPNYVIRRKLNLTSRQVAGWRNRTKMQVVTLDEIKVLRDLRLSPEEIAERTRFSAEQAIAMREEFEGEHTNLDDKIKYFYVEITNSYGAVLFSGMLGKEIAADERSTIVKNVKKGKWNVNLI